MSIYDNISMAENYGILVYSDPCPSFVIVWNMIYIKGIFFRVN